MGLAGGGCAPVDLQVPRLQYLVNLVLAQRLLQVPRDELLLLGRAELVLHRHYHDGGQQAVQAPLDPLEGGDLCRGDLTINAALSFFYLLIMIRAYPSVRRSEGGCTSEGGWEGQEWAWPGDRLLARLALKGRTRLGSQMFRQLSSLTLGTVAPKKDESGCEPKTNTAHTIKS